MDLMSYSQFGKEKYLPNYQTESMSIVTNIKCYTRVCQYGVYTLVCTTTALSSKHVFHFSVCVCLLFLYVGLIFL